MRNYIKIFQEAFFIFFFNTDKSQYQLSMAKLISGFIYENEKDKSNLIPNYEIWLNTFLSEIGKKFKSIDVLRLDKYIMLIDQVISTYLTACLQNNLYNSINSLIDYFSNEIENNPNNFNFSFESNKISIINRFINLILNESTNDENTKEFLKNKENGFITFLKKLLYFYKSIKDKRQIKFFNDNILDNFPNKLISYAKNNNANKDLLNQIKEETEKFFEENKSIFNNSKIKGITYVINKLNDEKFEKPILENENIVDPVNDYIMKKNYMAKFRKTKEEIKKEKINKKEKKKSNNPVKGSKDKNKVKMKLKEKVDNEENKLKNIIKDIDCDNVSIEKEIINLEKEEEEKNDKILNKKIKRNEKAKKEK